MSVPLHTIGRAVAGALVALLIFGALLAFFFRQYFPPNESASNRLSHPFSAGSRHHGRIPSIGLRQPNSANPLNQTPNRLEPRTQLSRHEQRSPSRQAMTTWRGRTRPHRTRTETPSLQQRRPAPIPKRYRTHQLVLVALSAAQTMHASKSSMGLPSRRPTRLTLHTDAEEELELLPQYANHSDLHP